MFIFAPVLGGIADRYGRKPALVISMLGLTIGFMLCASGCYFESVWLLLLGRIISGATAGSLSVAQAAAVDLSTPQSKSFYLSVLMMSNCLGFSLGPVLGGLFMLSGAMPVGTVTFLIGIAMSSIGLLSVLIFFKETFIVPDVREKFNLLKNFLNIKISFAKPVLGGYLWVILSSMLAFGVFYSDIPIFLSRIFDQSKSLTGAILSSGAITFSLTLMFGGKYLFNYFNKITVVLVTLILQLIAYLALTMVVKSIIFNVILFISISAFTGLMYIALLTLVSDATESSWQGRVMGVVAALSSVTWGAGPLLTGGLNSYYAGLPFGSSALLITLGLLALQYVKVTHKNIELVETQSH